MFQRSAIVQHGYVVKPGGLEAALEHWTQVMGAGPFFRMTPNLSDQIFRGAPTHMASTVGLAYMGNVQIELIEPTNEGAGPYLEWLEMHPIVPMAGTFHHFMVDAGDFDATYARLLAGGCKKAFDATGTTGGRIAYLESFDTVGGYIELIDIANWTELCARLKRAHRDWDGSDPVRAIEQLPPA